MGESNYIFPASGGEMCVFGFCQLPHQNRPVRVQILETSPGYTTVSLSCAEDKICFHHWLEKHKISGTFDKFAVPGGWVLLRKQTNFESGFLQFEGTLSGSNGCQIKGFRDGIFVVNDAKHSETENGITQHAEAEKSTFMMRLHDLITMDELKAFEGIWKEMALKGVKVKTFQNNTGESIFRFTLSHQTETGDMDTVSHKALVQIKVTMEECDYEEMDIDKEILNNGEANVSETNVHEEQQYKQEILDAEGVDEKPPYTNSKAEHDDKQEHGKLPATEIPWSTVTKKSSKRNTQITKWIPGDAASQPYTSTLPSPPSEKKSELKYLRILANCHCFTENFFKFIQCEYVKEGDIVVAKTFGDDDIVGTVKETCVRRGPPEVIYVRVCFEKSLFHPNLTVLHQNECYDEHRSKTHCDDRWLFIRLEYLVGEKRSSLFSLIPKNNTDEKQEIENIIFDIETEANRNSTFVESTIDLEKAKSKAGMRVIGIEGFNNSCYLDAFFFSIFAFSKCLDYITTISDLPDLNSAIRNVIIYDVVSKLRKAYVVKWKSIQKLRKALRFFNEAYETEMMDVEELALTLFTDVLSLPHFIEYDNGEDYIHQIFVAENTFEHPKRIPTVQWLLEQSFKFSEVKLRRLPQPIFLLKLPVSGGKHLFERVFPNPKLSSAKLLENPQEDESNASYYLRAVICLSNHHFTCFVRTQSDPKVMGSWIFHDSLAEPNVPRCVELQDFDNILSDMCSHPREYQGLDEHSKFWAEKLFKTCYICVYEPDDEAKLSNLVDRNSMNNAGGTVV